MTEVREADDEIITIVKTGADADHKFTYEIGDYVVWMGITCEVVGCSWDGEKETFRVIQARPPEFYINAAELTAYKDPNKPAERWTTTSDGPCPKCGSDGVGNPQLAGGFHNVCLHCNHEWFTPCL